MQNRARLGDTPLGYIPVSGNSSPQKLPERAFVSTSSCGLDLHELFLHESILLELSRCGVQHFSNRLHGVKVPPLFSQILQPDLFAGCTLTLDEE